MNQFARLFEIDRQIRDGAYPNADALAAQFELTPRQIQYDCARLKAMGAPIRHDRKRGGWGYTDPRWLLPAVRLSEGELLAFFLSVEIARAQGNAGLRESLSRAATKIAQSLGDEVSVDLNALRASTSYNLSPAARVESEVYLQLQRAAAARQKVRLRYFTATRGQWSQRTLHPYHLHFARGEWLLIAYDENRDALRCFNIARIEDLSACEQHFERDLGFDAQQYVEEMFVAERGEELVEVAVKFDEYQARYIRERTWHPQQKPPEEQDDGGLILRFPASGLNEIARWVMGYGRHAEVLEPPQLRQIVRDHLRELAQIYEQEC